MINVHLKKKREKNILRGNPWIFSGSIHSIAGTASPGSPCTVFSHEGECIGTGYINRTSAITVRMTNWGDQPFTEDMLFERIAGAIGHRSAMLTTQTDSCRLINSEGDFLPGLIVDKFGDGLVIQILTAGMELLRTPVLNALISQCTPEFIFERSDTDARKREGLSPAQGCLHGTLPETTLIRENGLIFSTDIASGQKTGYFFDQRDNRELLRSYAAGKHVADCFSYNGPFSAYALSGGAQSVCAVDRSEGALEHLKSNITVNNLPADRVLIHQADVFAFLRNVDQFFDCIVLDPPKFARHPGEVERAARGYKDINLAACKILAPGGLLFTFSCSHAIDNKLFRQIIFGAAADSGRRFQLLHTLTAGADHPVNLAHKEGEYLKGLVLRVDK